MKKSISISADEMQSQVESWNLLPDDKEAREFTTNHMIHAYTTGVNEGMEKNEKLFQKQLADNQKIAAADTLKVIDKLKQLGVKPISAHLRVESLYALDVLVTVSDDDFMKDVFSEVYECVNKIQEESKSDLYSVTFTFINKSNEFDLELLKTDGYFSSFAPLEPKK